MKKGIYISFFLLIAAVSGVFAGEPYESYVETIWVSLSSTEPMGALLGIEFLNSRECLVYHAYKRTGENDSFEKDITREEWYLASETLLIIQDNWGEFIPLTVTNDGSSPLLTVKLSGETIALQEINRERWEGLMLDFSLTGQ